MLKPIVYKSFILLKLSGIVAKLSLLFTFISTVATLFDTIETEMGWAIDAICIATYLIARCGTTYSYDKTQHIPPVAIRIDKK